MVTLKPAWKGTLKNLSSTGCLALSTFLLFLATLGLNGTALAVPVVTADNGLNCAGTRAGKYLGCTANDFTTTVILTNSTADYCTEGDYFFLDAEVTMNSGGAQRYNIGFFTGEAENDPQLNDPTASCSVATFPTTPLPWFDGGGPNSCGDFGSSSTSTPTIQQLRVRCSANPSGTLQIPYAVTWEQNDNNSCSGPLDVIPGTQSKCLGGTATVSNVVVIPRAAGYYQFDESSWNGTTGEVNDSSDNGLHGTAAGGANTLGANPALSGDPGSCRYGVFDGQNDEVVIPHNSALEGTSALTYAAWIQPTSWSGSIRQVMSKSVHGGGSGRAQMGIFSENGVLKGRAMTFNGDSTSGQEIQTSLPSLNAWTHVTLVFDGSSLTLYINGAVAATTSFGSTTLRTNNDPLIIGNDYGRSYYFEGSIDEARIYTAALNDSQISALKDETHPCPLPPVASVCSSVFPSPLQNSDLAGSISFGWNAQALSDTDGILETVSLNYNPAGASTCGALDCTASGTASTPAVLPSFPTNNSTTDVSTSLFDTTVTLGEGGVTDYRTITIGSWPRSTYLDDSGAATEYHIKTLNINSRAQTITLRGGTDYWIETLNFNDDVTINVSGSGTARLFIQNPVSGSWGSEINPAGSPEQLLLVTYNDLNWNTGNGTEVNALVYSSGNIAIGSNVVLSGALASPGQIHLGSSSQITYDDTAVDSVDDRGLCGSVSSGLHHIEIAHDGQALTCEPEMVTVKSCANADCSTLYTTQNTFVTLSPSGWVGGDSISFNGSTTVALRKTTPGDVTLGTTIVSPVASNSTLCMIGTTENCTLTFSDTGFVFDVPNLTACKTSADVAIRAVKTTDDGVSCGPAFSGTHTVDFWSAYSNPTSGTQAVIVSGTPVGKTSVTATGIALDFDSNGSASFTVRYDDAGQLQLNANYTGSGVDSGLVLSGSDIFAGIPAGLAVYSPDANAACLTPYSSCSAFKKAGENFNLALKAACWQSDTDTDLSDNPATPNYRQTGVNLAHTLIAPTPGNSGGLSLTTADLTDLSGITTLNQSVSEVGVFRFSATPPTNAYFGSTVPAGISDDIGRFYPDHFITAIANGVFANACTTCPTPFTYLGLGFSYSTAPTITATARNASGLSTQNYTGDFAKLTPAGISLSYPTADNSQLDQGGINPISVNVSNTSLGRTDNGDGSLTFTLAGGATTDTYAYVRTQGLVGPFTADLSILLNAVTDTEASANDLSPPKTIKPTGNLQRFGRAVLGDTHGRETEDLSLYLWTHFFDGTDFVVNGDDVDTTYTVTPLDPSAPPALTNPLCNDPGTDPVQCSQVSVGGMTVGHGSFFTLSAPGAGNTGKLTYTLTVDNWLQFDWGSGAYMDNPSATATFGIFRGDDRYIYWRETQ